MDEKRKRLKDDIVLFMIGFTFGVLATGFIFIYFK